MRRSAILFVFPICCVISVGCNRAAHEYAMVDQATEPSVLPVSLYDSAPLATAPTAFATESSTVYDPTTSEPIDWSIEESADLTTGTVHVVAKGDTLFGLARRYYRDQARWKDILNANRNELGDPNLLRVGQRLIIP